MKAAFLLAAILALHAGTAGAVDPAADRRWIGTWVSAQQLVEPANLPPSKDLSGQTLRQIVQPSLGGDRIRVTISNVFGDGPLTIAAATVAPSLGGPAIDPGSLCPLTFGGERSVTIDPGTSIISDVASCQVRPLENLAVSTYCTSVPARVTGHPGSRTTSFILAGDHTAAADFPGAIKEVHWYLLAAVDVPAGPAAAALVILGDSITDGRGSTNDKNNRWPDNLARRLRADSRTREVAVLNLGIGGNCVLRHGLGPPALQRFDRDVLVPPGVRWLVIFEGINDLGTAKTARAKGERASTPRELLLAYDQMIERAHAHGLKVYGATIMPFQGFEMYYNEQSEADRQEVNRWIRTSGRFDGVIDFDEITRDPQNPLHLSSKVDGGDHLHPSAEGHQVMADGIDLSLFENHDGR